MYLISSLLDDFLEFKKFVCSFKNNNGFKWLFLMMFLTLSSKISWCAGDVKGNKPRVSIITSVYRGDQFIKGFMEDIVKQTIFDQCELIIINAASPDHEDEVIREYLSKYSNIIYKKLERDPGLYGVWNMAIKMARADLITNANIDDRRNPESIEVQAKALDENPDLDLVFNQYAWSNIPNQIYDLSTLGCLANVPEFSPKNMWGCLPGPQPMWRKSMHDKYGYFDESYKLVGDYEMWLRAVSKGSKFKKIAGVSGVYYANNQGLTYNVEKAHQALHEQENEKVICRYRYLWT